MTVFLCVFLLGFGTGVAFALVEIGRLKSRLPELIREVAEELFPSEK